jgi:Flp pilus assembly pilin Flp
MKMLSSLKSQVAAFKADESGATLVEYAVLAVLLVAVGIALTAQIQTGLNTKITNALNKI